MLNVLINFRENYKFCIVLRSVIFEQYIIAVIYRKHEVYVFLLNIEILIFVSWNIKIISAF